MSPQALLRVNSPNPVTPVTSWPDTEPAVVGGTFALDTPGRTRSAPPSHLSAQHSVSLVNARSAIALLLQHVGPGTVWLPSYLCQALLDAVAAAAHVRFYEVTRELRSGSIDWVARVARGDLIVVIDYFGIPFDAPWAADARDRGALLLRDASQALLSGSTLHADFCVYSPRKFLGVPDGGILTSLLPFPGADLQLGEAPVSWWLDGLAATVLRRSFDRGGGSRDWVELHQRYEAAAPVGMYRMSHVSRTLLDAADWAGTTLRRVCNYRVLAERLSDIALFPRLPEGVVPLGFPVRMARRDKVRQALFDEGIYPAIHWPVPPSVPAQFEGSRQLAGEILTLPCDQRYGDKTMERMARIVASQVRE